MPATPPARLALLLPLLLGGCCPPCARAAKPVGLASALDERAGRPGRRPRLMRNEGSLQEELSDDLPDGKRVVKSGDVQHVTSAVRRDKDRLADLASQASSTYNTGLGLEEVLAHYKQMLETGAAASELASGLKAIQDHHSAWKDSVVLRGGQTYPRAVVSWRGGRRANLGAPNGCVLAPTVAGAVARHVVLEVRMCLPKVQARGAIESFKTARDGLEDAIKVYGDTLEER